MRGESVVVVGAGQAGCQVAVSLREQGHRGSITLVGDEQAAPYQRPPLTKAYLAGETDLAGLVLRQDSYYADHGIQVVTGERVIGVDRSARVVVLGCARTIGYDHLVFATGARPRPLPVPGAEHVLNLRTVADADVIRQKLEGRTGLDVVVIGGGFIGLEFAAVVRKLRHEVTVVETQPRVMQRAVSEATARHLTNRHRREGVQVLTGTGVAAVREGFVELTDGTVLVADLVVAGIGVIPNAEIAQRSGLACDDGIVVDAHLRTVDPRVHAIGDCARFARPLSGGLVRLESVQNAVDQAGCVAAAILGSAEPYTALPWFWSDQYDVKLQIAGLTDGHDRTVTVGDPAQGKFSVFCFRGDRLLGVEAYNRPVDFLMARRLMDSGATLTPEIVGRPGFDLRLSLQQAA
ncbi:3-phenylpropionate/trans-cinnamate dioxygenase ferredoxin reductase subunit [Lentzea atacamensis]|uniref:3-phenylpropionate/trans-cinnamate dioxygenase ferredoxin reductase subunit n=1 Tax=Lentzea atacamensis TaxID=531938 RepID=A0ABX9E2S5_9PSEU|nr:FAD-dependent oxidoreductase [Lentzea atacamensis]RAS63058.1 3-phenylpropionate/trans-cinnamate dioxygenase ferredoxin reductase subunit [Lentzea atacamensis]